MKFRIINVGRLVRVKVSRLTRADIDRLARVGGLIQGVKVPLGLSYNEVVISTNIYDPNIRTHDKLCATSLKSDP